MATSIGRALSLALLLSARVVAAADVTSTWIGPQGEWTDGTLWSTSPVFPENGAVTYAVVIGDPLGAFATSTLSRDLTVDSLLLQNAQLTSSATLQLPAGLTLGTNARLSGGSIVASGSSSISGTGIRVTATSLTNLGSASWQSGDLLMRSAGIIINAAGATFSIEGSSDRLMTAQAVGLRNEGTLLHRSTGIAQISAFENTGLVRVESGALRVTGLAVLGGRFEVASGALLRIGGGLAEGATISGDGNLEFATSEIRGTFATTGTTTVLGSAHLVSSGSSTARLVLDDFSSLRLEGDLSVAGDVVWHGGHLWGTGPLAFGGTLLLEGTASRMLSDRELRVERGLTFTGGSLFLYAGAVLTNGAASTFAIDAAPGADLYMTAPNGAIRNEGLLRKTGAGSAGLDAFENTGSIRIEEGVLRLSGANHGGSIEIAEGAAASFGDFRQTSGVLRLNGGDVQALGAVPLRIDGGSVIGNGQLAPDVENHGLIAPGEPGKIGQLAFANRLDLFDDSELDFEIGGHGAGIGFDVIDVRTLTLDGDLSVRFIDGFETLVTASDVFEIARVSQALQGVLDNVVSGTRLATADGLGSFAVFYGAGSPFGENSIVLTDFREVPEPAALALLAAGLVALALRARRD